MPPAINKDKKMCSSPLMMIIRTLAACVEYDAGRAVINLSV